jgi:hypothetical protein
MAANRYAEMVRWMAWPRIKNSRSSAQPGTHPHNGVQATVNPAPDAEPPPGSGQNTGVHGTTHAVAYDSGGTEAGPANPADDRPRIGRLSRPIRYAHSGDGPAADPARPGGTVGGEPPAVPPVSPSSVPPPWEAPPAEPFAGTVLSGTVLPGPAPADEDPADYESTGYESTGYESTGGLIYEAPHPAYAEPLGPDPADDVIEPEPVHNEGLGIFGGVATTEVPDDTDTPTRDHQRAARPAEPGGPPPAAEPEPTRVIPIGAAWNQPIAHQPVASEDEPAESKPNPFGLVLGLIRGSGHLADDEQPRVSVRDLPPDVQVRFIRIRVTICLVVGLLFGILTRSWEIGLTLAILAWIVDTVRRSRSAALYANGARFPGARKDTIKQLRKMRREGYFSLDARPIPNSREYIDHLVVGPTGVYAIDSEKWNPPAADQDLERQEAVPRARVAEGAARARRLGSDAGQRDPVRRARHRDRGQARACHLRAEDPVGHHHDQERRRVHRAGAAQVPQAARPDEGGRDPAHPRGSPDDLRHRAAGAARR